MFHIQSPPRKPEYYSFSQPMPSAPASSILLLLPALLSSAPPAYPSSDDIPHQFGANVDSVSQQVPAPDTALSDVLLNVSFATFHTSQSDTPSPPGDTDLDNTDHPHPKYS